MEIVILCDFESIQNAINNQCIMRRFEIIEIHAIKKEHTLQVCTLNLLLQSIIYKNINAYFNK
jgi:hypothetical protein